MHMEQAKKRPWQILDATILKLIAIAAMFLDHVCKLLYYPDHKWMISVGRLTMPIMAFFISEGVSHTKSKPKYILRLLMFAVISEVPFDLMISGSPFYMQSQNVMFTLLFGAIGCCMIDNIMKGEGAFLSAVAAFAVLVGAYWLRTDYGYMGVIMVMLFHLFRSEKHGRSSALFIGNGALCISSGSHFQLFGFLAIPLLAMYNGERGRGMKYLFYIFYPLHMLLLWLLVYFLY